MGRMKLRVWRVLFWLVAVTGAYYWWSRFWRLVLERKFRKYPVKSVAAVEELEARMARLLWVEDALGGAFDVISCPGKVQHALDQLGPGEQGVAGDCDEFAVYAANVLKLSPGAVPGNSPAPVIMSVVWLGRSGRKYGHNVCVFSYRRADMQDWQFAHLSNWRGRRAVYGFETLSALVRNIIRDGQLVGYLLASPDIRPLGYCMSLEDADRAQF